jgi:hypothetical protein
MPPQLELYFVIAGSAALWVAFDARRFDWHRDALADRPWKWVVATLFLSPIALPAYLRHKRRAPFRGSGPLGPAKASFSAYSVAPAGSAAAAVERAAAELAASNRPAWRTDVATPAYAPAVVAKPPLLVSTSPADLGRGATDGSLGLALLAGAAVAFVGGLLWAGVVIATRWDIGFLAWVIGAATGSAVFHLYRAPVGGLARVSTGVMAAGGILVGKYVIFVHDLKHAAGLLAQQGLPINPALIGYSDSRVMGVFIHHLSSVVRPIYGLWILIAFVAALRTAHGRTIRARTR